MDPISGGCRLCLDPFAEIFTTIDNPEMEDQMKRVFCFTIELKQGYSSDVCQSCSYAISEFYHYSEKVRKNQEVLNGNVTNCKPTLESKDIPLIPVIETKVPHSSNDNSSELFPKKSLTQQKERPRRRRQECVNVEALVEPMGNVCETKAEILVATEDQNSGDGKSYQPFLEQPLTNRKGRPKARKLKSVQVETLPDSTNRESKNDVSEEEGVSNSGDDESYEPPSKRLRSKQNVSKADESTKRSKQDILFGKHFRMICDLCGVATATFTALRRHFWKDHQQRDGYVVCCNKKLSKRYAILDHIDFHADPDVFRCKVCGKIFKSTAILKTHMLCRHASEDQRTFKCDLCRQSFAQKCTLVQHMERHSDVKCVKCDKSFASKGSLNTHIANQHSGKDRTMVCDTCGQEFLNKVSFEQHVNEHMGIDVERFQCAICQRWLKGERNFRNHMNWVHADGSREFQCDLCLQKYPHSRALQLHKKYTHAEPTYECEFCGKKFKKAIVLKEHRTTHTGEVLYSCDYCGIPNNCMANLYMHIKRQHPVEWAQKKLMGTRKDGPP